MMVAMQEGCKTSESDQLASWGAGDHTKRLLLDDKEHSV